MKRHDLFRLVGIFSLILLWAGAVTTHLSAQCTGEVLNISAPTHSTSGTTANWTVPSGGPYKVKIMAKGAVGGGKTDEPANIGGNGASMIGDFMVSSGQTLQAIAGAPGQTKVRTGGGGGGSGVQIQTSAALLVLAGGGGGSGERPSPEPGGGPGLITNSGTNGGGANKGGGGGGGYIGNGQNSSGGYSGGGGGGGFNGIGGFGLEVAGLGGGGFGAGGGGGHICNAGCTQYINDFSGGGGGGYSGGGGGFGVNGGGGGGSYNVGTNQNNTADANNAGGQVIIECLGTATFTAIATPTQPVCATPTQGSASIDLTGDWAAMTNQLEYAVVSGGTFSGSPTFTDVPADPFSITSGTGTVADLDGETYTVRVRVKYNPAVFIDQTYTLTDPTPCLCTNQRTWTGALSTDWHTAGNWNPTCVPTASDDVTIPDVTNDPTISAVAVAKSVRVNSGAVLTIAAMGSLAINGFIPYPGSPSITTAFFNAGTVTNNGILSVGSTSSAGIAGISNTNTISNNAGGQLFINSTTGNGFWNASNAATMTNAGNMTIGGIASVQIGINNQGSFTNTLSGEISIDNATSRGINNFVAITFLNYGTITIGASGSLGAEAIRNTATSFDNNGCTALIKILSNSIILNTGIPTKDFNNSGIIIENATGTSNITNNSGIVQNLNGGTFNITNNTGVLTTVTGDLWTGCTSTDWHTAINWHDGTVPTATDDVTIPDVTNDPTISAAGVAKSVTVYANASLTIAAASSLTIEGSTGFPSGGMYNLGTVTNNGMILVGPNTSPGQYGIVNEATFSNNAGAELKVDRTNNMGFWNRTTVASLTNAGAITIGGTANINGAGMYNEGDVQNTGGEIRIDRFNGAGLHNLSNSTVTNSGKILIGKTALSGFASGIYNFGHIQNLTAGEIEVDRTTSGIYNTTSGSINSSFTNEGKIAIGQTAAVNGPGIYNYTFAAGLISFENKASGEILLDRTQAGIDNDDNSTFDNSGLIKIGTTGALTGFNPGIYNFGTFDNKASAEIRMDAVPQSGLDNRGTFTNGGKIIVGINVSNTSFNPGVFNQATFVNQVNAELHIDRFTRAGFHNSYISSLTNAGLIKIGENVLGGEHGLYNAGTVNNQADGEIHVDNIPDANNTNGIYNGFNTNFTNAGKVFIGTAVGAGSTGLYNYGTFGNSGEIRVDNVRGTSNRHGLRNDVGSFTNTGKITLGGSATVGDWGLYNTSTFNNNTGGEISIDRCNITGLRNESGTFTSNGSIALGGIANIGSWGLWNQSAFNNNTGGEISIDRTSNTGLLIYSGTFNNNGGVTIGAATAVGDQAIYNQGTLANGTCAQLNIFAPLHNVSTLTNLGLFQSNTTAPHTNTGFPNNGIIAYPQGNPIPNVTNNEIIISPTTFNGCSNISPAFTLGTPLDMTVLGVFTDAAATMSAGSYATATNTFTPTATLAVATYNFFVKIQDGSGGCTRVVPWQLNLQDMTPPSITCPNDIPCVEATSPAGAVVFYSSPTATDNCAGNVPVNAVLPSGSTFFVGVNTVVATAFDSQGNSAICAFTVQVCDRTPPTIQNMPNNISCVAATSPSGAVVTYISPTATDIVDITVPVTCLPASGSVFPIGSTTVVCTAIDVFGNMASSSFVVSVDGTPPSITCPANATVMAGANCTATLASYTAAATANDNCTANPTKVQSPVSGTVITGSQVVTLTATDGANNSTACTFTVTVVDQTAPSIICPANTNVVAGVNCTATLASYTGAATANDNCTANPNKMQSPVSGTTISGSQVVTLTATDAANNSTACTFTVTVVDQTAPSITCPGNATVAAGANCAATLASYTAAATANDNCTANPSKVQSPVSGTVITGSQVVTLTTTDAANNSTACTFTVTVVDQTAPSITCPGNATVAAGANCAATLASYTAAATANDNCTANPSKVQSPVSGTVITGSQVVTLTATDAANNSTACTFTVTVVDQTAPSITCPANATVTAGANCAAILASYTAAATANDNCTANPSKAQSPVSGTTITGSQVVILTATDGTNNSATCSFTVTVVDNTPPTVICKNFTANLNTTGTVSITAANVFQSGSDNCGNVNPVNVVPNSFTCANIGARTVVLTVSDGSSNTSTCSAIVTVADATVPTIICPANIIRANDLNQCSAIVNYATPIASDNCAGALASHFSGGVSGAVFQKGTTTVVWRATDGVGLTSSCSFSITINDTQKPNITCPANQTRSTDLGLCSAVVTYPTPTGTDNCGLPTGQPMWISGGTMPVASGANSVATFLKGINIVTWRVTDGAGLINTCTFRVTVNDTEAPTLTCPAAINLFTATNTCNATATYINPTFTDNCAPTTGTAVRISGLVSGSAFPLGNSNVVFQATDAAGNTRRCTMVVTVTDNQPPVITCPAPVVVNGTGSPCAATVFYGSATASDNCAGTLAPFLVTGLASGSLFPAGVTTNTFRAVAPNGQSSSCSFSVTVNCGSGMYNTGTEVRDEDLSIAQNSNLDLTLAPNPAMSNVTVSIEGVGAGGGTLLVFDAVGRLVSRQVIAENQHTAVFQVDDSVFAPGLYRVNLRATNGIVTKTLVVVKQ